MNQFRCSGDGRSLLCTTEHMEVCLVANQACGVVSAHKGMLGTDMGV
jgi:hypothetical protein